MVKNYIQDNC